MQQQTTNKDAQSPQSSPLDSLTETQPNGPPMSAGGASGDTPSPQMQQPSMPLRPGAGQGPGGGQMPMGPPGPYSMPPGYRGMMPPYMFRGFHAYPPPPNFQGMPRPPYPYDASRFPHHPPPRMPTTQRPSGEKPGDDDEKDDYKRPAIITSKDIKDFDEILQLDSTGGWASAQGEIDYRSRKPRPHHHPHHPHHQQMLQHQQQLQQQHQERQQAVDQSEAPLHHHLVEPAEKEKEEGGNKEGGVSGGSRKASDHIEQSDLDPDSREEEFKEVGPDVQKILADFRRTE